MTAAEYKRVRRYQKILTAWSLLQELLERDCDFEGAKALQAGGEVVRKWLAKEQQHFETTVTE